MPVTFGTIAGQEPSTVTFKVGTVVIARGSTNEQQEILVLGDPQTSNALARVVAAEPASTEFGIVTRVAGRVLADQNSTVWATQAAQAGNWTVRANVSSSNTDNPVQAFQGGAWTVSVSGYSTTANISSLAGKVQVVNSSAGDLNVTVAGYSTTVNVSSVAGTVTVQPNSTGFAAAAGFTFNSSGELKVIDGGSAAAGSTVATISRVQDSSNTGIAVGDSVNNAIRVNVVAGAAGGSTIVTVSTGSMGLAGAYDSSNALIKIADSANNALRVNVVAGAAGGSTVVTVSAKQQTYGAKTTLTITSSGLTSGSARESNAVDNTVTRYTDFNIFIQRKGTTGSSAYTDFYVYTGLGDTTYTDGATGSDAAFTAANRRHSRYLGSLLMSTTPTAVSAVFKLSDIFATAPSKWGLIEINNSAGTHTSSGVDLITDYEGVY